METYFRLVLAVVVGLSVAAEGRPQESWVGKQVVTTKPGLKLACTGHDGKKAYLAELKRFALKVLDDQDGQLQVYDGRNTGWFEKTNAVLVENAAAYFSDRIKRNPQDADAYLGRAGARDLKGQTDGALKDAEEAIRLNPSARAYNARGFIRSSKQEYDTAIADHTEAIRLDPKLEGAYFYRGVALAAKNECAKAAADFSEAIRLDPKWADAHANRGLQWLRTNQLDDAIADFSQAIRLDPNHVVAHYSRGLAWGWKSDDDKAIADLSETIRLDANYPHAFIVRGEAWGRKKSYDKAIADFSEALKIDPKNSVAYSRRGMAWCANRDYARAIADSDEAIRQDPKNAFAYGTRAWILSTCPDPKYRDGKKAIEFAQQAIALDPLPSWHMVVLAAAFAESGHFADAVQWQERAMESPSVGTDPTGHSPLELYRNKRPYRQE